MRKICFVSYKHKFYDDRIYWKQILSAQKLGYAPYYVVKGNENKSGTTAEGIPYIIVKQSIKYKNSFLNFAYNMIIGNRLFLKRFACILEDQNADIYHIHDYPVNNILKKLRKKLSTSKFIYDCREPRAKNFIDLKKNESFLRRNYFKIKGLIVQQKEYKTVPFYDYIITVDHGVYNDLVENSNPKKIEIVYNYTNLKKDNHPKPISERKYDLLYCGNMHVYRGIFTYIEALRLIVKEIPDFQFILVGKFYDKKLEKKVLQLITDYGLTNNITITGQVPYSEVSKHYKEAKIALNVLDNIRAHQDILQIKLFEYMNFGLPIIASDFGAMKQLITINEVGVAIPPNQPEELKNCILQLLHNKDLYNTYMENGKNLTNNTYNWKEMEQKLDKIYKYLLGE